MTASHLERALFMTTKILNSDDVIEIMIEVAFDKNNSSVFRDGYREALHSLVRLARAEQLLDMQRDFNKMTACCDTRSHY
jgi:hypothetical protein